MAINPRNSRRPSIDIWPGFVDALSQLLMVIIFILLVFTAGQFYLSAALSGREEALHKLQQQVDALANLLSLERGTSSDLRQASARLAAQLKSAQAERDRLTAQVSDLTAKANNAAKLREHNEELEANLAAEQQQAAVTQKAIADRDARLQQLTGAADKSKQALAAEKSISSEALAQVDLLNQQIAALRQQLSAIAAALDISQAKVKSQQTQIADLGQKLNVALASKVEELAHYRSEFFGRLRDILGNRSDIRIVGDRFVFQSEVLFAPGSADLTDSAKKELDPVIAALKKIATEIPPDINWILLVSGHTDHNPINTPLFASNWELSTARALSVVRYAISKGIPPDRVAAAGFADTEPIDSGTSPDAYRRNRRIELKLTER